MKEYEALVRSPVFAFVHVLTYGSRWNVHYVTEAVEVFPLLWNEGLQRPAGKSGVSRHAMQTAGKYWWLYLFSVEPLLWANPCISQTLFHYLFWQNSESKHYYLFYRWGFWGLEMLTCLNLFINWHRSVFSPNKCPGLCIAGIMKLLLP